MKSDAPLFSLLRDGIAEITVYGEIVATQNNIVRFRTADIIGEYPARSLVKPFQFLATGLASAELKPWHIPALGSISATEEQVERVRSFFAEERQLYFDKNQVPPSFPMDEKTRARLQECGRSPEPWYHPCFCKHAAILEAAIANDWPLESYLAPTHPFHRAFLERLNKWLPPRERFCVTDGCGLPSPVFSTAELASLFAGLMRATLATHDSPEKRVAEAMLGNPEWIGGPRRVDTRLMQHNAGRLIAKEGADGLLGIGGLATQWLDGPVGILVKISSGYAPELAAIAVAPVLHALGFVPAFAVPHGQVVKYHFDVDDKSRAPFNPQPV